MPAQSAWGDSIVSLPAALLALSGSYALWAQIVRVLPLPTVIPAGTELAITIADGNALVDLASAPELPDAAQEPAEPPEEARPAGKEALPADSEDVPAPREDDGSPLNVSSLAGV